MYNVRPPSIFSRIIKSIAVIFGLLFGFCAILWPFAFGLFIVYCIIHFALKFW